MNKSLSLVSLSIVMLAAGCAGQRFKKAKDGTEYQIVRNENAAKAVKGDFIELNIIAKYKDSILFSTIESSTPRFIPYDTSSLPAFYKEVYDGDSLIIRQSTDSIIKAGKGTPWMKKGEYIYQSFKVTKLFANKQLADSAAIAFAPAAKAFAAQAKMKAYKSTWDNIKTDLAKNAVQAKKDDSLITEYLKKNNITADKTPLGTYVSITTPGTGEKINENDIAVVNYTGKTFNDTTFDSNTDKKFNHIEPYYVDMGDFRAIPGWIDGLRLMQKGSKGKLIIPSVLAYGKNAPPKIGPDQDLVFDIEVTDVLTQDQYQKAMEEQQKQMMQQRMMMQQKMQEQMKKQQKQPEQKQEKTPPKTGAK